MAGQEKGVPTHLEGEQRTNTPRILVADFLPPQDLAPLVDHGYIVDFGRDIGITQENLPQRIGEYDALIVRSDTRVTPQVLAGAERLQIVVRAGVGVDNIEVAPATERGIIVLNTPDANTRSAAELTMGLLFAVARHIPQADRELREGKWTRVQNKGVELSGKTLALIGFGNVGSQVAEMAKGTNMRVVAYDPFPNEERAKAMGVELVSLEEALAQGDFTSVHIPLIAQTRHLINAERIASMKDGAVLLNVSRGGIVDEIALVAALNLGKLSAAALDVYEGEPDVRPEVRDHPKIVHTPHLGASTEEAQIRVTEAAVQQLVNHFEGKALYGAVNAPRIAPEILELLRPHTEVAYLVGYLAVAISDGKSVREVQVEYAGDIAGNDTRPLRASVVRGLFATTEEHVNLVNYESIIYKKGIPIIEKKDSDGDYPNLVTVTLSHTDGSTTTVSGNSVHEKGRLVPHIRAINDVDGADIPIKPDTKHIVIIRNTDVPGIIGRVGRFTGDRDINIDDMSVRKGEPSMLAVTLDRGLSPHEISDLQTLDGIKSAQCVEIP